MKDQKHVDVAVVGGGIVGLGHAYMAAKKGLKVVLFDRHPQAVGASIRNFGLIWPIGQGLDTYDRAMRSRNHWLEVGKEAGLSVLENGSLHLAYLREEMDVLEEFVEENALYNGTLISPEEACKKNALVKKKGLLGALWSPTELTVNPRESIAKLPMWLRDRFGVVLKYGEVVKEVAFPNVILSSGETWKAEQVYVCSGADFETLYPDIYKNSGLVKCKLQMMRAASPVSMEAFGPSLCAGLTLGHYASFSQCKSLQRLKEKFSLECPEYGEHGVHVLLSLNNLGELVIGDSHHYGLNPDPFDKEEVNSLILRYLSGFTTADRLTITERWHGIYPKLDGKTEFMTEPEVGVKIVNGLGGAGMTLSFGLAEENLDQLYDNKSTHTIRVL